MPPADRRSWSFVLIAASLVSMSAAVGASGALWRQDEEREKQEKKEIVLKTPWGSFEAAVRADTSSSRAPGEAQRLIWCASKASMTIMMSDKTEFGERRAFDRYGRRNENFVLVPNAGIGSIGSHGQSAF